MLPIIAGYAFLASGILANKIALKAIPVSFFVGLRMLGAGLIIFATNHKTFSRNGWRRILEDWWPLILIALGTTFVPSLCKAYALKNMPSGKATLLGSIDPFITALYVFLLWGERINWRKAIGMLIGFSGIAVLVASTTPLEETLKAFGFFSLPELAAIVAVIVSRGGWLSIQKFVRNDRYTPLEINGIVMTISGIVALISAALTHGLYFYPGANLFNTAAATIYTIIGGNIFGYTIYTYALKHYAATLVSLAGFLIPIFVTIGAYFLLGEPITAYTIIAAGLIFTGLTIFHTK